MISRYRFLLKLRRLQINFTSIEIKNPLCTYTRVNTVGKRKIQFRTNYLRIIIVQIYLRRRHTGIFRLCLSNTGRYSELRCTKYVNCRVWVELVVRAQKTKLQEDSISQGYTRLDSQKMS